MCHPVIAAANGIRHPMIQVNFPIVKPWHFTFMIQMNSHVIYKDIFWQWVFGIKNPNRRLFFSLVHNI
jgi:hypothetical protein